MKCIKCKSKDISVFTEEVKLDYKNTLLKYDLEYSICNSCDREFITKEQILRSDNQIKKLKSEID